jgi:bifunctional ADP-heptose synthase (sugar kinase/adenylyltransferase)
MSKQKLDTYVDRFIDAAKDLKVAVVGETITDEFIYVSYEGQSMKSICPVFKLAGRHEIQVGGAGAIANHLKDFVSRVDIFTNPAEEIVKTRYVDIADQKKHVEINRFDLKRKDPLSVDTSAYDAVIVADFGHGFCDGLEITDGFHLMCQTNSNNFGFNRISKWKQKKKKSVCIDLREASLQLNKKLPFKNLEEVDQLYRYELNAESLFITVGSAGSIYFDGSDLLRQESYKSDIVDTIGAGDTFLSFVSLTSQLFKGEEVLVVPSLAASLSTTWLCNERSVTKAGLYEHAHKYL